MCSAQQKGGLCLQVSTTTTKKKKKIRITGLVLDSPTQLINILPHRQREVLSPWSQGAELMTKWAGREQWQGINKEERTFHLLSFLISILLELMAAECTTRTRPLSLGVIHHTVPISCVYPNFILLQNWELSIFPSCQHCNKQSKCSFPPLNLIRICYHCSSSSLVTVSSTSLAGLQSSCNSINIKGWCHGEGKQC